MQKITPEMVTSMKNKSDGKEILTDEQVDTIREPVIDLPEIFTTRKWKEANPETDPMMAVPKEILDVLFEKQDRRITLVANGGDAQKERSLILPLPMPPQIIRNLLDLHDDIEVLYKPKEYSVGELIGIKDSEIAFLEESCVTLISNRKWETEARDKFIELREEAKKIIIPIYQELTEKLRKIPNTEFSMDAKGIKVVYAGVDLSDYYRPNSLVSAYIAAQAAGMKLKLNTQRIRDSFTIVIPEFDGVVTLNTIATKFNQLIAPHRSQLPNFDLVAAFAAPSIHHDGLDIVNVRMDGNGGYVNLSRDLALYLYGKDLFVPIFKHENDMMMLSVDDIDAFAVADCADWIDYSLLEF